MSEQLKKYLFLKRGNELVIQEAVNNFYDLGYKLRDFQHSPDTYIAIMELGSGPDVREGIDFVNMEKETNNVNGSPLIKKMTDVGWVPISEYSKHVTLMKPKEKQLDSLNRTEILVGFLDAIPDEELRGKVDSLMGAYLRGELEEVLE